MLTLHVYDVKQSREGAMLPPPATPSPIRIKVHMEFEYDPANERAQWHVHQLMQRLEGVYRLASQVTDAEV